MGSIVEAALQTPLDEREQHLRQAGYNVVNIHPSLVEYDLMTDSWTELLSPEMSERMQQLRDNVDFSHTAHRAEALFPFKYFINVSQGRAAEACFWKTAGRKDRKVIQNLLFPTTRHHLVLNRMMPLELPVAHVFDTRNADLFRGNLDCAALRDVLRAEAAKDIACIYIEAENNASGGYPVSLSNVREINAIASDYGVPMVLDATRLIENAVLIQRFEPGCENYSLQQIVHEFCSYFDHMTCSLAKDFGITRGGLIATNDEKIYYRARDVVATFGPGINATDKAMINAVFDDIGFVEQMVNRRVDQAARLHAACVEKQLPLAMPAAGHCLLFNTADYLDTERYDNAVAAFTAHVYEKSGVRGGLHVTGMMREYAHSTMVRFAIPLCAPDSRIDALMPGFLQALSNTAGMPDMEKISSTPGIAGQMYAHYQPRSV